MIPRTRSWVVLCALANVWTGLESDVSGEARHLLVPVVQAQSQPPQPRRAKFLRKEYEQYDEPGTSTIVGQAFLTMPNGEREYCSREAVFMNPVTTYTFEWYRRNVIERIELEPADERASEYHWVTRSDARGRFRFRNLPAGEYYIGCRVLREEGFAHAEVIVGEGEGVEVLLTRAADGTGSVGAVRVEAPRSASALRDIESPFGQLNPAAPPETTQWGRLAGAWDCTLTIDGADGTVRLAKAAWTWAYTIDGYAVRDEYVGHRDDGPDFHGSGVRIYNPTKREWEITWIDNSPAGATQHRMTKSYRASYQDGQIVMRQVDGDSKWRTVFFGMSDESFEWRNEPSEQTMRCERLGGSTR